MPRTLITVALAVVLYAAALPEAKAVVEADLVLKNGEVWTVDADRPQAAAIAIQQGRILAVGSNDEVTPLIGTKTKVIDLNGRRVLPGCIDSRPPNDINLRLSAAPWAAPMF